MPIAPYNGPQYQYMGPNAYGPYPTVPMQPTFQAPQTQPQPQAPIQTTTLPGRVIKPNETVTPQEVPMDGTPLAETTMIETIDTANSFENMAAMTALKVCPGEDVTLSVTNTGTSTVTLDANSALYIRRIA